MPTYYINPVTGVDSDTGLGEQAAWQTLAKAESVVVAGDHVFAKNNASYTELLTLTASGTAGTGSIIFEGYENTPGDGGIAVIDAQNTRANCITAAAARPYRVFRYFRGINATDVTFLVNSAGITYWEGCQTSGGGNSGFQVGTNSHIWRSDSRTSVFSSFTVAGTAFYNNCLSRSPTGSSFNSSGTGTISVIFGEGSGYGGSFAGLTFLGGSSAWGVAVNCLFDGKSAGSTRWGISSSTPSSGITAVNTMILKNGFGIRTTATSQDSSRVSAIVRTQINGNTSLYGNGWGNDTLKLVDFVSSAPAFVSEGTDYKPLANDSPQVAAGRDIGDKIDIGPFQRRTFAEGGGPAGGLIRPKILDGGNTT